MKASFAWMAAASLLVLGCGDGANTNTEVTQADGQNYLFVANSLKLPTTTTPYTFDLNGDGAAENKLGTIISTLSTLLGGGSGTDPVQAGLDGAVNAGQAVVLFTVTSTDSTLAASGTTNVGVRVALGNATANPPLFNGTDSFTVSTSVTPGQFYGRIGANGFAANNPATTRLTPVTLRINLPIAPPPAPPLSLSLNGAYITFRGTTSGSQLRLMEGQIHGSITVSDINNNVLPAVAQLLTGLLSQPTPPAALIQIDNGGGGCATANDNIIATCELAAVAGPLLSPDLQIFSGTTYAPCKTNCTARDSISVGLGFTAVPATF